MSPARRVLAAALTTVGFGVLAFGALAPPEHCPAVTTEQLRASAEGAVRWMTDNQEPDGRWLYEYDRAADQATDAYNDIRHAGVMSSLYQADAFGIDGARASADRGLAWVTANTVERHGWSAVTSSDTVSAGTNALLLAGLVERRLSTGDTTHDELMARLGRFLVGQVEPSGALLAYYDLGPDRPRPGGYSRYYTGEAYWALARMHLVFPDGGWGEPAELIGRYLATERDDAEDLWPPLPDHWAGYGLAETVAFPDRPQRSPLTDAEVEYARRQAGLFGAQVRFVAQRMGDWGAVVRSRHVPRGGGFGVLGEGLTGLWRAARGDERLDELVEPVGDRAACIAALAIDQQTGTHEAGRFANPGRVAGAWFRDDVTRMDDQQHALSGLLRTAAIIESEREGASGPPAPSAWLWALAVIAVVNPVRAALGAPRAGRARGEIGLVALLGAIAGAGLVLAVGSTSGWVLDELDVSEPSMRIAAGVLAALSGAADLVRSPPAPEPALRGRWAALVPVAVPLVARPAMVFVALSAVADHGLALLAAALAGAVAVVALAAPPLPQDGPWRRAVGWLARLAGAAAVAAGVVLVVNGMFDI